MPDTGYLVVALLSAGLITLALRALPFVALKPLRESQLVKNLGIWMPAGVLTILALATLASSAEGGRLVPAVVAVGVTVLVHLLFGRHSLLSIAAGTITYVVMVNWF
ncbi:MAG: branched-chain amino acid transporter AzlD [Propionibacterium sp.]|nr:branched-chain amino acid transporter AzlD [Propionibacterium sp.]